jgi:hypothetical protein
MLANNSREPAMKQRKRRQQKSLKRAKLVRPAKRQANIEACRRLHALTLLATKPRCTDKIDPNWCIPIDVQLTTIGAITNFQAGCTIGTVVEALRARA